MGRFFISSESIFEDHIKIIGEDVNHIKNVLRLRVGETLVLCDSRGTDYMVKISEYASDYIRTEILNSVLNETEPPIEVTLYQGLPKADKMDLIVQKCIELGVKRIVPVTTDRTVVRIESRKDAGKKVARWQRIALEAAKQCNRGMVPVIELPISFEQALKISSEDQLRILPYEKETSTGLKSCITRNNPKRIAIFIGPEGGFTEKEVDSALSKGIQSVTLGPRILRTETAGIAVLSILMYELGDAGR